MNHSDCAVVGINTANSGCLFGKGIYTANNPLAFCKYGSIGIFIARLKGTCVQWDDVVGSKFLVTNGMHTVLGSRQKKKLGFICYL